MALPVWTHTQDWNDSGVRDYPAMAALGGNEFICWVPWRNTTLGKYGWLYYSGAFTESGGTAQIAIDQGVGSPGRKEYVNTISNQSWPWPLGATAFGSGTKAVLLWTNALGGTDQSIDVTVYSRSGGSVLAYDAVAGSYSAGPVLNNLDASTPSNLASGSWALYSTSTACTVTDIGSDQFTVACVFDVSENVSPFDNYKVVAKRTFSFNGSTISPVTDWIVVYAQPSANGSAIGFPRLMSSYIDVNDELRWLNVTDQSNVYWMNGVTGSQFAVYSSVPSWNSIFATMDHRDNVHAHISDDTQEFIGVAGMFAPPPDDEVVNPTGVTFTDGWDYSWYTPKHPTNSRLMWARLGADLRVGEYYLNDDLDWRLRDEVLLSPSWTLTGRAHFKELRYPVTWEGTESQIHLLHEHDSGHMRLVFSVVPVGDGVLIDPFLRMTQRDDGQGIVGHARMARGSSRQATHRLAGNGGSGYS